MKKLLFTLIFTASIIACSGQTTTNYFQYSQKTYLKKDFPISTDLYKITYDKKTAVLSNVTEATVKDLFKYERITNTPENIYYIFYNTSGDMLVVDIYGKMAILFEEKRALADWNYKTLFFNAE